MGSNVIRYRTEDSEGGGGRVPNWFSLHKKMSSNRVWSALLVRSGLSMAGTWVFLMTMSVVRVQTSPEWNEKLSAAAAFVQFLSGTLARITEEREPDHMRCSSVTDDASVESL